MNEYDDTFDSSADTTLPFWEANYAANKTDSDWWPNYEDNVQRLKDSINGKMKAGCIAEAEIPPEDAAALFDLTYAVTVGGRVYDGYNDANYAELPAQTYEFYIAPITAVQADLEKDIRDIQISASEEFAFDTQDIFDDESIQGEIKQRVHVGFSQNPFDTTSNTNLEMFFEIDGPEAGFVNGARVYQYMSFLKADDFESDPITVACVTKIGNPKDA